MKNKKWVEINIISNQAHALLNIFYSINAKGGRMKQPWAFGSRVNE